MRKLKLQERRVLTPRMEWYYDEVPKQNSKNPIKERGQEERNELAPHMEWCFDETTQQGTIKCPVTGKKATVEIIRSASREDTPFVLLYFWLCPYLQKRMSETGKLYETL